MVARERQQDDAEEVRPTHGPKKPCGFPADALEFLKQHDSPCSSQERVQLHQIGHIVPAPAISLSLAHASDLARVENRVGLATVKSPFLIQSQ